MRSRILIPQVILWRKMNPKRVLLCSLHADPMVQNALYGNTLDSLCAIIVLYGVERWREEEKEREGAAVRGGNGWAVVGFV